MPTPSAALLTTAEGVEHTHVHDLAPGRFSRARVFVDDGTLIP